MKKQKQKESLNSSTKLLAFMYSIFIVVPIYFILGNAYYLGYINGFVYVGTLLGLVVIALAFSIIFRKDKFRSLYASWAMILLALFMGYEVLLLDYESNTYIADYYAEPEEIIQNAGIYILTIGLHHIHVLEDEATIREIYERDSAQIYDLYKITNRERCRGKTNRIKQYLGLEKDSFQLMKGNVEKFIQEDIPEIHEFLNRENYSGDSAGLALGLSAMVHQGNLQNQIPIGVTGTLEPNGDVDQVGGIAVKMIISEQSGFPYMIVPYANLEEAETVKAEQQLFIEILPVNHFDEAVIVINELNELN